MMHRSKLLPNILTYLTATIVTLLLIIPFLWMVSTSFKPDGALMTLPVQWIPRQPTLYAYEKLFTLYPFGRIIFNSVFLAVTTTALLVIICSMAAFIFAKVPFRGRDKLFLLFLAGMMIPMQVTMIPLFLVMSNMHLLNTYSSVILPSIFSAYYIFMIRQAMIAIPDSYMESATLDGAGYCKVFVSIILPLSKGILATVAVLSFMDSWNNYLWPLIVLTDPSMMTLPVALSQLSGQYGTKYNIMMAGSLISMIPILILYICGQKFFTEGLQVGGIKG